MNDTVPELAEGILALATREEMDARLNDLPEYERIQVRHAIARRLARRASTEGWPAALRGPRACSAMALQMISEGPSWNQGDS